MIATRGVVASSLVAALVGSPSLALAEDTFQAEAGLSYSRFKSDSLRQNTAGAEASYFFDKLPTQPKDYPLEQAPFVERIGSVTANYSRSSFSVPNADSLSNGGCTVRRSCSRGPRHPSSPAPAMTPSIPGNSEAVLSKASLMESSTSWRSAHTSTRPRRSAWAGRGTRGETNPPPVAHPLPIPGIPWTPSVFPASTLLDFPAGITSRSSPACPWTPTSGRAPRLKGTGPSSFRRLITRRRCWASRLESCPIAATTALTRESFISQGHGCSSRRRSV